jgi:hypothetical protein
MGVQHVVLIEYLARLLIRGVQEVIKAQLAESQKEYRQQLPVGVSRDDGQKSPPESMVCSETEYTP